jgi:hypothetical protein
MTEEEMKMMAIFLAQLVREGIVFEIGNILDEFHISFTGGY